MGRCGRRRKRKRRRRRKRKRKRNNGPDSEQEGLEKMIHEGFFYI